MIPHKHAEVLRAIADGVPLDEFEVQHINHVTSGKWYKLVHASILCLPDEWSVRRRPQSIMVNGFKVPKPLEKLVCGEMFWLSIPWQENYVGLYRYDPNTWSQVALLRGLCHSSEKAAAAHAKAMLGIDPQWEAT